MALNINTRMTDSGGNGGSKKTTKQQIAEKAAGIFLQTSNEKSKIIEATKSLVTPKNTQQSNKAAGYSYVANNPFYVRSEASRNNLSAIKSVIGTSKSAPITGSQFSGVAQQARNIYEQRTTYNLNNTADWGRLGASRARGDLTTNAGLQNFYYTNRLDDDEHTRIIGQGETWLHGAAVEKYLRLGEIESIEDVEEAEKRYEAYEEYLRRYVTSKIFFNSETGELQTHQVIRADAPLPPWVLDRSTANLNAWEYYKSYESEVGEGLREQALDLLEEREKYAKHGYKSAFNQDLTANLKAYPTAEDKNAPVIDSFADVVYSSLNGNNFFDTYKTYVKEYHINPLLAGKFTTVLGNHLWNLMDTMDFASRGVRAFVAGDQYLGGTQHTFKGQKEFWIDLDGKSSADSQFAQRIFLANGGDVLLRRALGDKNSFSDKRSDEEIINELKEAFDDPVLKANGIRWEDVYDAINEQYYGESNKTLLSRAFENVKEAYTNPEAEFSADTDSVATNMLLESVLDPGLIVGGMAKTGAYNSARDVTDIVLRGTSREKVVGKLLNGVPIKDTVKINGILNGISNLSPAELDVALNKKTIRKSLEAFAGSNESRNIIFKNADNLKHDARGLAAVLSKEGIIPAGSEDDFVKATLNALTGTKHEINGKIIGSQAFDEIRKTRKTAKVAAYADKAIDTIDMAIIKGTFIEPFALSKIYKGGRAVERRIMRNVIASKKLDANEAAALIVKNSRSGGLDNSLKTISDLVSENKAKDKAFAEEVEAVKNQFRSAASRIEDVNTRLVDLTPDEAMREVSDILSSISKSADNTIIDIDTIISDIRKTYAIGNDMDDVFNSLKRSYNSLTEALERQDYKFKREFLNEVRDVKSADELALVVNKYSDKINVHDIRVAISDILPDKSLIPEEEIDNILRELDNGLLAERSATLELVKEASGAVEDVATRKVDVVTKASDIIPTLKKLPTLDAALKDAANYPYLRKLDAAIASAQTVEGGISTDRILKGIIDAHARLAISIETGMGNQAELRQISNELLDLKASVEKAIDTSNAEVITQFHLDKQAKYDTITNDHRMINVFTKLYDSQFKPAVDLINTKIMQGVDAFGNSGIYESLLKIGNIQYSYQRYRRFVNNLTSLGIPEEAVYAIKNGAFGNYGETGKRLVDATRKPGQVRRWLDAMMYNEFSSSKVGMDTLTAKLASIDSFEPDNIIADYVDEIKNNPTLNNWYHSILDADPADPQTYLQKQVISDILMDPKAIERYNSYDKSPIFLHVSTTGLSDDSAITGLSYYRWRKIEVGENGKPTMSAIYDALNNNSVTYKCAMSDADIARIDDNTLYSIYKTSIGERSLGPDDLRRKYKDTFGIPETGKVISEQDILEHFFDDIYEDTISVNKNLFGKVKSIDTEVPTFVVHDLDGFNIPFINRRAAELADDNTSRIYDYATRLSKRVENTSINTFDELRAIANDNMLSNEEFEAVEAYIKEFAEDLATNTSGDFNMLDIQELPNEMRKIMDDLNSMPATSDEDDIIKALRFSIKVDEADNMLSDADEAIREVGILDDEAKQIATLTYSPSVYPTGNLGNVVRNAASNTGERIINVADRYDMRKVLRYFSFGDIENGVKETFSNIQKMSNISRWVDDKLRYSIRSGAEEFLAPDKDKYDALIEAVRNLALSSNNSDGYFTYLRGLQIPQSATESYLICQKLYDDLLKYWLNSDLILNNKYFKETGQLMGGLTDDAVRQIALAEFVDNLHFNHLISDGFEFADILHILEGEGHSLIFKDVPTEYVSEVEYYTSHGKMKEGLDLARKLKKGYTQIKSVFNEQEYLDSILRSSGIITKKDFGLGMMYSHTADFLDYLDDNKLIDNPRFRRLISEISEQHVSRVNHLRLERLKVDGVINSDKLLAEMLYNNANHIVFQKAYYSKEDIDALSNLVKQLNSDGKDFIKIAQDRSTVSIYLTNKCEIIKGVGDNGREVRYIHKLSDNTYGVRYFKPELENISLPSVDELIDLVDNNDLIEFQEAYNMLRNCWDDVSLLSDGASNGTLGRVVTSYDADEYYKIANTLMPDLLSSEGMRKATMHGSTIYDPGFMLQGDYDIFTEYLHTMESQAEKFKVTGGFLNNVFGTGNDINLNSLAEFVSDEELINYFSDNSDFVLCSLVPAEDTKLGVSVKQLRLNNLDDVATARQMNTAVLPYDMFLEMSDSINIKQYPSDLNRAINKMMLVYKAGALFHPGTWIRNFVDATQKAATDLGESPLNFFSTFMYEMDSMREINKVHKLLNYGEDFLNEANWTTIQRTTGTKLTFEEFNLLRGMLGGNRYVSKADSLKRISNFRRGGREVISGDNLGLRNLDEKDITSAYNLTKKNKKLGIEQKRFIEIYTGRSQAINQAEFDAYEETMRTISDTLHNGKAVLSLNNAVSASFVPFNMGETIVRFSQLRQLNELGFSHNQAIKRVHMTQFRARDHYGIANKLEYIIPFITFKYNNLKYWMRMMDENPAYFKYFQKLYGNITEDTIEQYNEKGQQLDYESSWMLKTGGIPIGNGKYYFKLNPSFYDALDTMYGWPTDLVSNQNPLLRLASRALMYDMGLHSKYIFQELNLRPSDVNVDVEDILTTVAPRISKLTSYDKITKSGYRTWDTENGPDMDTLWRLLPSLIGKNYSLDYEGSNFEDYQNSLLKQGFWYDCNLGEIVEAKWNGKEYVPANEAGINNPNISWMDRNNFMMVHFDKIWDSNLGKFVPFWEQTQGGLNQSFDFENDSEAWDKLCAEYERKGMKFDYNTKHFISTGSWRSTGLNNPDLTFEERSQLMEEKFGVKWDANQNCFIDINKGEHYISGGLNDTETFRDVMLYRYALFGETYNRDTHHFEATDDAKVVVIDSLYKTNEYNNYFAMLGIPKLANLKDTVHLDQDGLLVTSDGKYVLVNDNAYNQRVFNKIRSEYGGLFSGGRQYNGWKNYSKRKTTNYNKKPYKGRTLAGHYYTGYGWNSDEGYYRLSYQYSYQYHSPQPNSRLHHLISPPIFYPYGGEYGRFSFQSRY